MGQDDQGIDEITFTVPVPIEILAEASPDPRGTPNYAPLNLTITEFDETTNIGKFTPSLRTIIDNFAQEPEELTFDPYVFI